MPKPTWLILQDLIINVRNLRAEQKIEPRVKVPLEVLPQESRVQQIIEANRDTIERLASVEGLQFVPKTLDQSLRCAQHLPL